MISDIASSLVDRDMFMRFLDGGVGHKSTRHVSHRLRSDHPVDENAGEMPPTDLGHMTIDGANVLIGREEEQEEEEEEEEQEEEEEVEEEEVEEEEVEEGEGDLEDDALGEEDGEENDADVPENDGYGTL